ncbi:unnamed protein product [Cuscuta epithymum]|uniref:3'-5' exonuclease domain-containing protein n=1 Tax=Cuscuta epithymum TaxID=186058 RepID=A0AAV0CK14_9ASTE|nr:unnamed protein product [Cuscuta epithymum]CAH9131686.1 unnamed protein product [Cuscuta epithymum]
MDIGIVEIEGSYDLFTVNFHRSAIETLVTCEPSKVVSWINDIERIHRGRLHRLIVGLDVEWRPSYSRDQNPVATLQLAVGDRCLIVQLLYCSAIPDELFGFLANSSYTFVGVGIGADLEKLVEDYNLAVTNGVELRNLAADQANDRSLRNVGLKDMARRYLGVEMVKPRWVTMGRWDQEWLSTAQIQYACVDAFVCFEVGRILDASVHQGNGAYQARITV